MFLPYIRPGKQQLAGFQMDIKLHECGGIFGDDALGGIITSPNYPKAYSRDEYCIWLLMVPGEQIIEYSFETFSLSGSTNHRDCREVRCNIFSIN
jgi:hypothetical protein